MSAAATLLDRLRQPPLWAVLSAILAVHGAYTLLAGVAIAPDSIGYGHRAEALLRHGFDYAAWHAEVGSPAYPWTTDFPLALYAMFVSIVALLQLVAGENWPVALVAINLAAQAALGALVVRLAGRLCGTAIAEWAALLLFLACFDLFNWAHFALSDTSFALIAFVVFTLAARRILGDARGWLRVAALALVGVFYRPTGFVLLPDLVWAAYLARRRKLEIRLGRAAAAIAAGGAAAAFGFAWLMQDPGRWPFGLLSGSVDYVARYYAIGEVVSARPETFHAPPSALVDYALISADRFLHFFAIGAAEFSLAHWAVQLVFFVPAYTLAGWFLLTLARGRTGLEARERKVFLAALGAVLAYASFHGLVQVDYDWRYRVPILAHIILLAAAGASDLAERLRRRAVAA